MKLKCVCVGLLAFCFSSAFSQVPSVQLTIKEKSGFLGMGGPRVVQIQLSSQEPKAPITSENVNSGPYYYFFVTPVGEWKLDEAFIAEELSKVSIFQDGKVFSIEWKSPLLAIGDGAVLLGFSKSLKLHQVFLFQYTFIEKVNQVEFTVPQEYWPGYSILISNLDRARNEEQASKYREAIWYYDQIISDQSFNIFPQYDSIKTLRVSAFEKIHDGVWTSFQSLIQSENITGNYKNVISQLDNYKPSLQYILDSLARPQWNISSLDPHVVPVLSKTRESLIQISTVRDSLQHVWDEETIRWILTSSSVGKNGYLYQYIIETLAYAFSSLPFDDTTITSLQVNIPDELRQRLVKNNLTESYETFIRVCNERFQMHLPIFPVEFLPNLRNDTASFPLPYYSMLKAVNDYYSGNWADAQDEIFTIFRTCYEQELTTRFDGLRVAIRNRQTPLSSDILSLLKEAQQAEAKRDVNGATERYRQVTLVAPNFAYGFFLFGKFYARTGDVNRAIFYFQRAYELDTMYLSAYRECYNNYLKLGNYKPMIDVMNIALAKGNDFWEIHFNLGMAYMGDGDLAKAIQHYEKALMLNPKSYKANLQLGLAYQNAKNYQKAREYFNNAIGIDPARQEAVDYLTKLNELQRMGK
ncbi:MAG: tetratricopeptide repeat protein [Bacteroidetes bacterium]|nr:tetratricopeptide repeat protein [Bacteroidota bacterium]